MIICLQSTRFPPYNIGGEEIYVKRLYDSLSKDHVVYNINNTVNKKFKDQNVINLSSKSNRIFSGLSLALGLLFPDFKIFLKLKKILKWIKPDVFHINNPHSTFSSELFFVPIKGARVFEIHDYSLFCPKGPNIYKNRACNRFSDCWKCVHQARLELLELAEKKETSLIRRIFIQTWKLTNFNLRNKLIYFVRKTIIKMAFAKVDRFICPSKNVLEACNKFGINEKKLAYLPYGIDLSRYIREKIPKKKAIGFVGQLEKVKGCHVLINAFKKVVEEIPDAYLYIVGDGREEDNLRNLVKNLSLSKNVFFLGRKTLEELKYFYPSVKFLVVPSIWLETPALVTYEALASGRPVIASNIGDFPEIIKDGENGFLFELSNSGDLAKKIIYLLQNPKEVNRLAKNAFKTIKRYSIEEHNKKLIEIYKKAIKNS